ncbi:MAG: OOP family OmpA-OmpF porin [Myxococcota bacterium]
MHPKGSATIKQASFPVLDEAANILKQYKSVRVRISGHTDNRGADDKNMTLSRERARSVAAYLAQRGIDTKRMAAVGFGETKPIGPNTSKQGRAMNRRIEFEVIR